MYAQIISMEIQKYREVHVTHVSAMTKLTCSSLEIVTHIPANALSVFMIPQENTVKFVGMVISDLLMTCLAQVKIILL